jgi:hypothetical protein
VGYPRLVTLEPQELRESGGDVLVVIDDEHPTA